MPKPTAAKGIEGKVQLSPLLTKRGKRLLTKYGITEDDYESLLQRQGGACGLCNRPAGSFKARLCIDHDHKSGIIRGLLCTYCNRRIIGRHRKEVGAELLRAAAEYLQKEYTAWIVPKRKKWRRRKKSRRRRV